MANQTLDNFLYFSNGYGCIQAQDANHQIIIRADRNGTPSDYTNHYQYGGTIAAGLGHKFWTGGVLASQTLKFHIADDGNYFACKVGIGTSTPSTILNVASSAPIIRLNPTTQNNATAIEFGVLNAGTCAYAKIDAVNAQNYDTNLRFFTNGAGDATQVERMRITYTGNVGIGTTSPSYKLQSDTNAASTCTDSIVAQNSGVTTVGHTTGIRFRFNTSEPAAIRTVLENTSTGTARLGLFVSTDNTGANLTERLSINCNGNIGIGTSTPCNLLHVNGGGLIRNGGTDTSGCRAMGLTIDIAGCAYAGVDVQDSNRHMALISNVDNRAIALTLRNLSRGRFWDIVNEGTGTDKLLFNTWCNIESGYFNRVTIEGSTGNMGINTCTPGTYKLNVNGSFYAAGSSQDYKQSICNYNTDSCMFMKLKPVTYQYKEEYCHLGKELKSGTQIGLIAEEVAETYPELAILVKENDNDVVRNVDYEKLSVILLSEVQKLRREVDDLKHKQ